MAPQFSEVKSRLLEIIPELQAKYPLKHLWIFGSVARGEATEDSDVDILVEYSGNDGFTYAGMCCEIADSINHSVDIVENGKILPQFISNINSQKILIV